MSFRDNRAMTGANTTPLGGGIKSVSRAAMGGTGGSLLNPSYLMLPNMKREPVAEKRPAEERERESRSGSREDDRKRKRRSRWEAETEKIVIPGIPTTMPAGLNKEQEEAYLCKFGRLPSHPPTLLPNLYFNRDLNWHALS